MREAVRSVIDAGRPFFGICIGMQLLFERSEENPEARGLAGAAGAGSTCSTLPTTTGRISGGLAEANRCQCEHKDDPASECMVSHDGSSQRNLLKCALVFTFSSLGVSTKTSTFHMRRNAKR